MSYRTFTRTWWKHNKDWPEGLEPCAGRKTYYSRHQTAQGARDEAQEWNRTHKPGRLSRKMEFEEA